MSTDLIVDNGNVGVGISGQLSRLTVKAKSSFVLTGTVAKTASSATLVGTGTQFLSQVGLEIKFMFPEPTTNTGSWSQSIQTPT